ncbi:MAG TPA: serine/threonine-protein kinase [bacterium]|jgi:serine/threonine-protein kinase
MADHDSRLTLTREIARSGIATVWEGYDSGLDRKVLVKSIHPQYARESDLRMRFEREARAIAKLSHPNVVQIYDLHAGVEELSLILEFVEGASLGKLLKDRGALPVEVAVTLAAEILAGLEHAHAAGIIHRDLKPDNVLVSKRGEVKITDFGLASLKDQPTVTQEGMVIGTPSYMAPEQADGSEITPATDVFALGLILFEMLTGKRIHAGATLAETFQNVLKYQPPRFEDYRETISPGIEFVLRRMLEKAPARRYTSAVEAHAALLQTQPDGLLPNALIADFLSGDTVRRPVVTGKVQARARSKSVRTMAIGLLVVVAAGAAYQLITTRAWEKAHTLPPVVLTDTIPLPTPPGDTVRVKPGPTPPETLSTGGVAQKPPVKPVSPQNPPGKKDTTAGVAAARQPGTLDITCRPWATVYIADSLIGTTPLPSPLRLSEGTYSLVLVNPEIGLPVVRTVTVKGGQTTDLRVNLYDYVARIRIASVKPWADVFVNGKFELRTPSSKTIFRPLGTYTLSLKNPDYPVYTDTLTFREGEALREIRVDLTAANGASK